jgi:uncharacterized membrane protein YvlD (DUF360 family)
MADWKLPTYQNIEGFEKFKFSQSTLGDIISALLPYLLTLAGLGLFLYLITAGFAYMTSAGDPKKTQAAREKITNALIGLIVIFVAYWLIQILEKILGLEILGG